MDNNSLYNYITKEYHLSKEKLSNEELVKLLNKLSDITNKLDRLYKINLKPSQLELVRKRKTLDTYDIDALSKIESLLSSVNDTKDDTLFTECSDTLTGLNVRNIFAAETLYNNYLTAQSEYIESSKKVNKYSLEYKTLKEQEDKIITKITSSYLPSLLDILKEHYNKDEVPEYLLSKCINTISSTILKYNNINIVEWNEIMKEKITKEINNYNKDLKQTNNINDTLIRKIINMIKTKMSLSDMHKFLNMNNYKCNENEIISILKELDKILYLYSDTKDKEACKDINLVVNTHNISTELALYIYKNKISIQKSLIEYKKINNIK